AANHTVMTRAISGRPARCLRNRFTALGAGLSARQIPAYPITYDAGKALNAAAKAAHEAGYGAQWAGQGAPLARKLPAAQLVASLAEELRREHETRKGQEILLRTTVQEFQEMSVIERSAEPEQRLKELGINLPQPPKPLGAYVEAV